MNRTICWGESACRQRAWATLSFRLMWKPGIMTIPGDLYHPVMAAHQSASCIQCDRGSALLRGIVTLHLESFSPIPMLPIDKSRFFEIEIVVLNTRLTVLQIYPENAAQAQLLTSSAMRAGFTGGLVVDYPHSTRAKKCVT